MKPVLPRVPTGKLYSAAGVLLTVCEAGRTALRTAQPPRAARRLAVNKGEEASGAGRVLINVPLKGPVRNHPLTGHIADIMDRRDHQHIVMQASAG